MMLLSDDFYKVKHFRDEEFRDDTDCDLSTFDGPTYPTE